MAGEGHMPQHTLVLPDKNTCGGSKCSAGVKGVGGPVWRNVRAAAGGQNGWRGSHASATLMKTGDRNARQGSKG